MRIFIIVAGDEPTLVFTAIGDKCGSVDYMMTMTLVCDRKAEKDAKVVWTNTTYDKCTFKGGVKTVFACPIFSLTAMFYKYNFIFAIAFIGAGLIIVFFGLKLFSITLFILATLGVSFILLLILYQMILPTYVNQWAFWVCLGVSVAVGLTVAYFVTSYEKYCFVLAGAYLGGVAGYFAYNLFLSSYVASVTHIPIKLFLVDALCPHCWRRRRYGCSKLLS